MKALLCPLSMLLLLDSGKPKATEGSSESE
jgi:hypothetical protein